jgi:DNA-binding GntR family transcriptional regulator
VAERAGRTGPKYRQIADELRTRIERGDYPPGSRLPTKTELMGQYNVAVNTVERAIDELRKAGIVETVQGAGMFVREARAGGPASAQTPPERLEGLEHEVAALREAVAKLQAQLMDLYHSTGQPYPYEDGGGKSSKRAAG